MATYFLILISFIVTLLGCEVPEPDWGERLLAQKRYLDLQIADTNSKKQIFIQYANSQREGKTADSNHNVNEEFYIAKDSILNGIAIVNIPISKSGDWYIEFTHYFDNDGKTFAFQKQANFFNSGCTEGVAYETIVEYYNDNFELVSRKSLLVDANGNALKKENCSFPYNIDCKVLATKEEYFKTFNLNTSNR